MQRRTLLQWVLSAAAHKDPDALGKAQAALDDLGQEHIATVTYRDETAAHMKEDNQAMQRQARAIKGHREHRALGATAPLAAS